MRIPRSGPNTFWICLLWASIFFLGVPSAWGQSGPTFVDLRVLAEDGESGLQVRVKRVQGGTERSATTNADGVADFSDLPEGTYAISVPERNFRETVEVSGGVWERVQIPSRGALASGGQGKREDGDGLKGGGALGGASVESGGSQIYLLYGLLGVLVVIAGGLLYLAVEETEGQTPIPGLLATAGLRDRPQVNGQPSKADDPPTQGPEREVEDENVDAEGGVATDSPTQERREGEKARSSEESDDVADQDNEADVPGQETEASAADPRTEQEKTEQYTTEKRVGSGGMSTVWLAQDGAGRDVALKVMSQNMLDDDDLVRKFTQEGKALQRINSTHPEAPVVDIYDYGYFRGENQPYLALEYLPYDSLERFIDPESPLPVEQVLPVTKQIAVALSAAHVNDIYHRDVKPENVLIVDRSSTLRIKLIDFGVARHNYVPYATMDGSLLGTPPYMSPEQGEGKAVDERSDIYSLGILAYALLTGEPPFVDENPLTVLKMHQEDPAPSLPDHIPAPVADLLFWMLEKDPVQRPSKMWEVIGRIDELIADASPRS